MSRHAAAGGHDWREAGDAWGHAANDWACLYEHYALDVVARHVRRRRGRPGDEAARHRLRRRPGHAPGRRAGRTVAGIDAAAALVEVARARDPDADVRIGSMFELPWAGQSFDAARVGQRHLGRLRGRPRRGVPGVAARGRDRDQLLGQRAAAGPAGVLQGVRPPRPRPALRRP